MGAVRSCGAFAASSLDQHEAPSRSGRSTLRTLAETVRWESPEFTAAVDRLVTRLRHYGAGEAAAKIGDSMPSFVLPDERAQKVSLEELFDRDPLP
jgi:hypothetical protein